MKKVMIVAHSKCGLFSPFVTEQAEALKVAGIQIRMFGIEGKGLTGYLKNLPKLKKALREFAPDAIHAHYGLSGLLANIQRKCPVITTYHGSDIHAGGWILRLSRLCMRLSKFNVFVSQLLLDKSGFKKDNVSVIPCGVDISLFHPIEKGAARKLLKRGFEEGTSYVLFAGAFGDKVKNSPLAEEVIKHMKEYGPVELLELKGYSRQEVNILLNSVDCLLMTSFNEGSPMVIKEAMAVGCPIVSVDVGDVKSLISGVDGCFVSGRSVDELSKCIRQAFGFGKTEGRSKLISNGLSQDNVVKKLLEVYDRC
ncbi:MAG: glycosyltransferase [Bacteroidales bacterium]|nr:glycosyltransferase [Bacteroidales bacterium]